MRMRTGLAVVLVAATAMTACGDDDDDEGTAASSERYCELVTELEQIGEDVFADLPEDATDEDFVAAERELVTRADAELDELVEVAPAEIADDVEKYVAGFRARARGEDVDVDDSSILAWEKENCPS